MGGGMMISLATIAVIFLIIMAMRYGALVVLMIAVAGSLVGFVAAVAGIMLQIISAVNTAAGAISGAG